jgi:hypothetical protein
MEFMALNPIVLSVSSILPYPSKRLNSAEKKQIFYGGVKSMAVVKQYHSINPFAKAICVASELAIKSEISTEILISRSA